MQVRFAGSLVVLIAGLSFSPSMLAQTNQPPATSNQTTTCVMATV